MKLVAYLRVSTDKQAEEGNGLDVQERMIEAWATRNGHTITALTQDAGISGTKAVQDRPGLGLALDLLHAETVDGIVVRDLDRLARSVTIQEAVLADVWRDDGKHVFTATGGEVHRDDPDDPMRTAMREMAGVFAGLERRMLVKRLRDGRKAKAARGGHAVGPAPYGWSAKDGELHQIEAEQVALIRMRQLQAEGSTTREIAGMLASEGHPTKRGGQWTSPVVSRILSRHPSLEPAA
jgi:DNA invertase Pin-like site-specific DNA recombinase